MKNPINKRVLAIYNKLLEMEVIDNEVEFGARIGYSQAAINYVFNEKRNPGSKMINAISDTFGANKNYIISGKDPMFLDLEKTSLKTDVSNVREVDLSGPRNNLTIVPLKAFGGFLLGYADKVFMDTLEKMPFSFVKGECFAFEVEGFSMMPDYLPGSYVVCTPVEKIEWLNKNKDYVFQTIDGIILKRFVKIDDNKCHVVSLNKDYDGIKPMPLKSIKNVYFVEYKIQKP